MVGRRHGVSKRNECLRAHIGSSNSNPPGYRRQPNRHTRMQNTHTQRRSSMKTVKKAWVFSSEKWIVPPGAWKPLLCRIERFLDTRVCCETCKTRGMSNTGTRVLEPAEYPGFAPKPGCFKSNPNPSQVLPVPVVPAEYPGFDHPGYTSSLSTQRTPEKCL